MKLLIMVLAVLTAVSPAGRASDMAVFKKAREQRTAFRDQFFEQVVSKPVVHPLVYAMAGLYTGKDRSGANREIMKAWNAAAGKDGKLTPKEAGASSVKWCMRGWLRIYYLFNDKSRHFPRRLEPQVQTKMEELFYNYGCYKSNVRRADLGNIWHIHGSENHDLMDFSNAYLALQAVQHLSSYKNRKLPDGHTPAQHVEAWEKYYIRYCLERAKNGLFVEISPTYGKWFVGEFVNMYEFAEDAVVRKRMEKLLHLMWADWSLDQFNGVRGGGKTRCYQGGYSQKGDGDSWDLLGRSLMGMKGWFWNSHGNMSNIVLMTSRYEPPDVVLDIALNKSGFTPFVYQSTRPGRVRKGKKGVYVMDPEGGGIIRYSYCLPESIMGSWMLDTRTEYAAIHTQNRWQGVIFPTGMNARVFPQSEGLGNGKTYQQHVAVQHRNVMIAAHHPGARQTGQMRVFFFEGCRDRIVEKDGWVILKEGNAWLGVRPLGDRGYSLKALQQKDVKESSRQNTGGFWLWPKADKPPVVLVTSSIRTHRTANEFLAYLRSHRHTVAAGHATYTFSDDLGAEVRLELGGKLPVPVVNGSPVNLHPKKVFDSPWLNAVHGSGVVTIRKGDRTRVLDFNRAAE